MPVSRLAVRSLSSLPHRHYATIAHDHWPASSGEHGDTSSLGRSSKPTPYQILSLRATEPYTKHRFIELVKLYHPDHKHSHLTSASPLYKLPEHVRLERYRLIVAAHALLSDPVKRAAYDIHGIGWLDGLEDSVLQRAAGSGSGVTSSGAARAARANATWEDWERWRSSHAHEQHDGPAACAAGSAEHGNPHDDAGHYQYYYQQRSGPGSYNGNTGSGTGASSREPVYMRNSRFASLLIILSIGAGAAQTMHAENLTEAKRLVREERHWQATQDYRRSQEMARRMGREQRIEEFVRQRDPAVLTHPTLKDLVMNPDLCESGNETGRYKELDMKRMFTKK